MRTGPADIKKVSDFRNGGGSVADSSQLLITLVSKPCLEVGPPFTDGNLS